jgi:hypothetical protein
MRQCKQCSGPIPAHKRADAIYCSVQCCNRWKYEQDPIAWAARGKRWTEANPERRREIGREYARRNSARQNAASIAWARANPERARETRKQWRERNQERLRLKRATNRAALRQRLRAWRAANPDITNEHTAARRARRRGAVPVWLTAADRRVMRLFYRAARDLGVTVDHIVPLKGRQANGLHVWWNLQLLSAKRNSEKHNRC